MKRDLFIWLKDRKVFTKGGHKTLREWLTQQEEGVLRKNDARYGRKKKK
jgi:hypothetical protein